MKKSSETMTGMRAVYDRPAGRSRLAWPGCRLHLTFIVVMFCLLALPGAGGVQLAQAQSPITAQVDRSTVTRGEQLTLTVSVTGDFLSVPTPNLDELADFNIAGKSEATQISIINGKVTSQKSFVYRLEPLRTGSLVIGQISVDVDGLTYRTAPIIVEVTDGAAPGLAPGGAVPSDQEADGLAGQDFFVEAAVSNPTPYLGEQIVYTFKLYQAANFLGQPDYRPPTFTDFWSQSILTQPRYNIVSAGRDYVVTEMRTALFPGTLGSITIEPAKLIIPGGLFEPDVIMETEPLIVQVQSLPRNAPINFNGAVGQFSMTAHFNAEQTQVNDPITFVLEISGAGNIEMLTEPALPQLPDWRAFESQASTSIEAQGDTIYGTRRFERLMVPGQAGTFNFPPVSFSYYDPAARAYQTIQTESLQVIVAPGSAEPPAVTASGTDKQQVELLAGDIRHIKAVPPSLINTDVSLLNSSLYWSMWLVPAALILSFWVWQNRQQRLSANVAYVRSSRARRKALEILAQTRQPGQDSYAGAHRALLGYLSDKLNRPTAGLTTNSLISLLHALNLDPLLVNRIQAALDQIDQSRFAPVGEGEARSLVADVQQLINDLEKSFAGQRSGK